MVTSPFENVCSQTLCYFDGIMNGAIILSEQVLDLKFWNSAETYPMSCQKNLRFDQAQEGLFLPFKYVTEQELLRALPINVFYSTSFSVSIPGTSCYNMGKIFLFKRNS